MQICWLAGHALRLAAGLLLEGCAQQLQQPAGTAGASTQGLLPTVMGAAALLLQAAGAPNGLNRSCALFERVRWVPCASRTSPAARLQVCNTCTPSCTLCAATRGDCTGPSGEPPTACMVRFKALQQLQAPGQLAGTLQGSLRPLPLPHGLCSWTSRLLLLLPSMVGLGGGDGVRSGLAMRAAQLVPVLAHALFRVLRNV